MNNKVFFFPMFLGVCLASVLISSCQPSSQTPLDPEIYLREELARLLSPREPTAVKSFAMRLEALLSRAGAEGIEVGEGLRESLNNFLSVRKEVLKLRRFRSPSEPRKPRKCRIDQISSASIIQYKTNLADALADCQRWYKNDLERYRSARSEYKKKVRKYQQSQEDLTQAEKELRDVSMKLIQVVKSISGTQNLVL